MKGCPGKTVLAMALILMLLAVWVPACYSRARLIIAELSFSEPPAVGKIVQLTATFELAELLKRRQFYAPEVTAGIVLPESFEKITGDLEWKGDMKPGDRHSLVATVRAIRTGDWEVSARADFFPSKDEHYIANATLYVSVTEAGARVSRDPPEAPRTPMSKDRAVPPPGATPAPTVKPSSPTSTAAANSRSLPLNARLSFSEPPALGKTVDLTATFRLNERFYRDARQVTGRIILPVGLEGVGGSFEWEGDLKRGESRTLSARVKAVKTGDWEVAARAEFTPNPAERYVGEAIVYVTVSATGASVADRPPPPVPTPGARASLTKPPAFFRPPRTSPIRADLSFSEPPALGRTVELKAIFSLSPRYTSEARDVTMRIALYGGFEKVDGDMEWKGTLKPGASHVLAARVKATRTGNWPVAALSEFQPSPAGKPVTSLDGLHVSVTERDATVSETYTPPGGTAGTQAPAASPKTPLAGTPPRSMSQSIAPRMPIAGSLAEVVPRSTRERVYGVQAAPASFTNPLVVRGIAKVHITDLATTTSPPADKEEPLVWGGVYVYDATNLDQPLAFTYTGATWSDEAIRNLDKGEFYITVENPYPHGITLIFKTSTVMGEVLQEIVIDDVGVWVPYERAFTMPVTSQTQPELHFGDVTVTPSDDDLRAAWRIYETIVNDANDKGAYRFMVHDPRGPRYNMPGVTARFPDYQGLNGAWYNPIDRTIRIQTQTESKALNTVLHEYGHRVYHRLRGDGLLDGPPLVLGWVPWLTYRDNEAWSEGWADFFSLIVKNDSKYKYGTGGYLDYELPKWGTPGWNDGDRVPGRVTATLWDLYDPDDDGYNNHNYDQFSIPFVSSGNAATIWAVPQDGGHNLSTLSDFWNGVTGSFSGLKTRLPSNQKIPAARALFQNTIADATDYPELRLYLTATVSPPSPAAPGTVTFDPPGGSYERNGSVTVTANPAAGWRFDRWTGELSGNNNPATITMDFDKKSTASFAQHEYYLTTYVLKNERRFK